MSSTLPVVCQCNGVDNMAFKSSRKWCKEIQKLVAEDITNESFMSKATFLQFHFCLEKTADIYRMLHLCQVGKRFNERWHTTVCFFLHSRKYFTLVSLGKPWEQHNHFFPESCVDHFIQLISWWHMVFGTSFGVGLLQKPF